MCARDKKQILKKGQNSPVPVVTETVGNYEKHPFFIKKAKAAKEILRKVGLPSTLVQKTKV